MGLSPEQVKTLLKIPDKKPRKKRGGPDESVREIRTWFELHPKAFGEGGMASGDLPQCDNPNCLDQRPPITTATGNVIKMQFTIVLENGVRTCRRCFLAGYGLPDSDQLSIDT